MKYSRSCAILGWMKEDGISIVRRDLGRPLMGDARRKFLQVMQKLSTNWLAKQYQ